MYNIVIIGGGGHARVLISNLKKLNRFSIIGYVDTKDKGPILMVPYLGEDNVLDELILSRQAKLAVLGIGHVRNCSLRKQLQRKVSQMGFDFPSIVSPDAVLNEEIRMGIGSAVMDGAVIQTGTAVGNFSIINSNATIDHDCQIGDFVHISPGVTISGGVKIGDETMIGSGATVIQGVAIAEKVIVGAGTVVVKNLDKPGIYIGIPARKMNG